LRRPDLGLVRAFGEDTERDTLRGGVEIGIDVSCELFESVQMKKKEKEQDEPIERAS
jgi:hypothetical protein